MGCETGRFNAVLSCQLFDFLTGRTGREQHFKYPATDILYPFRVRVDLESGCYRIDTGSNQFRPFTFSEFNNTKSASPTRRNGWVETKGRDVNAILTSRFKQCPPWPRFYFFSVELECDHNFLLLNAIAVDVIVLVDLYGPEFASFFADTASQAKL
jgi:hypothetical protein